MQKNILNVKFEAFPPIQIIQFGTDKTYLVHNNKCPAVSISLVRHSHPGCGIVIIMHDKAIVAIKVYVADHTNENHFHCKN